MAIRKFLYGAYVYASRTPLTIQFDYRWKLIKDGQFKREPDVRETTKQWIAQHLSVVGEAVDWVLEPKGSIKKAELIFAAKLLWLLVRHYLSPTAADNISIWNREVLMDAMVAGFEVVFAWQL